MEGILARELVVSHIQGSWDYLAGFLSRVDASMGKSLEHLPQALKVAKFREAPPRSEGYYDFALPSRSPELWSSEAHAGHLWGAVVGPS